MVSLLFSLLFKGAALHTFAELMVKQGGIGPFLMGLVLAKPLGWTCFKILKWVWSNILTMGVVKLKKGFYWVWSDLKWVW